MASGRQWKRRVRQARRLRGPRAGRRGVRWPLLAYGAAVMALSQSRRRLGLPRPLMVPVVSTTPLTVAAALPASRWRYAAVWATYMWLYKVAWEIPYDRPDKLRPRLRVRQPIRIDSAIGRGMPPTERLQRTLRDPVRLNRLDKALTGAFYGLFLAPHVALVWLMLCHEEHFPRAAGRLAVAYHLTTIGYWVIPSAPPWWASEREGEMSGEVRHVTREVGNALRDKIGISVLSPRLSFVAVGHHDGGGDSVEEQYPPAGNPWGSMPSDHFAAAALTARSMAAVSPLAGALGWACTGLAGFTLVYLGEHYVIDLIAGLAVAEVVWRTEPAVAPLARVGAGAALRALERLAG